MPSLCRLTYLDGVLCVLPHLSLITDAFMFWLVNLLSVNIMQKWMTQNLITPSELSKLVSVLYKYN